LRLDEQCKKDPAFSVNRHYHHNCIRLQEIARHQATYLSPIRHQIFDFLLNRATTLLRVDWA
jgi:hypothetical protein